MCTTPATLSLQLPDLLSFCSVFELRTNKHCRGVSQASEKWLLDSGVALPSMAWSAAKPGLLAGACHPSADATQLRFVTDFLSLLLRDREQPPVVGYGVELTPSRSGDADPFMLHPRWYMRFVKSQRCYVEASHQLSINAVQGVVPDLESYIEQRRDASGLRMALDMVQFAGDINIPETLLGEALFERLHDHACDIAAWSEDIVSCAKGISPMPEANINIVAILMRERNVPLECAVSTAGTLVKQSVEAFIATEEALLSAPELAADHEVRRYVRGLRNWVAGFVNWLYETRLFLGEKGNEVRAFGWVFIPVLPRRHL